MDVIYINLMFLMGILGILYVTLVAVVLVGIKFKKAKIYEDDLFNTEPIYNPETEVIEERHVPNVKKGQPLDILEKEVNTKIVSDLNTGNNHGEEHDHIRNVTTQDKKGHVKSFESVRKAEKILLSKNQSKINDLQNSQFHSPFHTTWKSSVHKIC